MIKYSHVRKEQYDIEMMGKYRSSAYDKRPEQEVKQYDNGTVL